jgi:general secretion pathway protein G
MLFSRKQKDEGRGQKRRGFSLIEVMIVVVIIGLLAGIVTYATTGYLERAKRKKAAADLAVLRGAVDQFYIDKGRFPDNREGLAVLVPQFVTPPIPNDPWGRAYQYIQPGRNGLAFEVITYGADGREGGTGADADLSSANLTAEAAPRK